MKRLSRAGLVEVGGEHAEHDARMMITENTNRLDQHNRNPSGPTTHATDDFGRGIVLASAATAGAKGAEGLCQEGGPATHETLSDDGRDNRRGNQSAVLESARSARAAAESRKAEIRKRAFVPVTIPRIS